jgi:hypothetical protein
MKGIYRKEGDRYIIYAKGTEKKLNKIYEKVVKAYPQYEILMGDIEPDIKCVGSLKFYSYEAI